MSNSSVTNVEHQNSNEGSPFRRQQTLSVALRDLSVYGSRSSSDFQETIFSFFVAHATRALSCFQPTKKRRVDILSGIDGLVKEGEVLLVLGRPGSGCSTLLRTLSGDVEGLTISPQSHLNYQGLAASDIRCHLRGKVVYQAEVDVHFPTLLLGDTLEFAVNARAVDDISRESSIANTTATAKGLGLGTVLSTKVGDALSPGLSGGERKRASIAEVLVGDSVFQCWDNSTRGLDSANAHDFMKAIRRNATANHNVTIVTLYQASEDIYNLCDKVLLLDRGRQLYFGSTANARAYFEAKGHICPRSISTPDFLTSLTSSVSDATTTLKLHNAWAQSEERARLFESIAQYDTVHPICSASASKGSPHPRSIVSQISICLSRANKRLVTEPSPAISALIGNCIVSTIIGGLFFGLREDTSSFSGRGTLLFFVAVLNTTSAAFEGVALWEARPILAKHHRYAFYRPSTEAAASSIADFPMKILTILTANLPLYLLANLRRTPQAFIIFYVFSLAALMSGSMVYRATGAISRSVEGSQPLVTFFVVLLMVCSGIIPFEDMRPVVRWFTYVNPVYYVFEALLMNVFSGRDFSCTSFAPNGTEYDSASSQQRICTALGRTVGSTTVAGDRYIYEHWGFNKDHLLGNFGYICAITLFYGIMYILGIENVSVTPPRGEIILTRQRDKATPEARRLHRLETSDSVAEITKPSKTTSITSVPAPYGTASGATFVWQNLKYVLHDGKDSQKVLLSGMDGWVRPGTVTAMMGPSGAGKTSLLNALAERAPTGVGIVSGDRHVDAKFQNLAFARKIGYAQQDDIHLATQTVREALVFCTLTRQSPGPEADKLAYVDEVLESLDLVDLADAVIGVPGEGLNVEQRKRVTIAVELAAKPDLLLFLDEPTSGLDSDTSLSICRLLQRLARRGTAVLCTVHQPTTSMLAHFDRLIQIGQGQLIYFGDTGPNNDFTTVVEYFERHGAATCQPHENPAEWLFKVIRTKPTDSEDWAVVWKLSSERSIVRADCEEMTKKLAKQVDSKEADHPAVSPFATSFWIQLSLVLDRDFRHAWYSPVYMWSKVATAFGVAFLSGIAFTTSGYTPQSVVNQVISLFVLVTLYGAQTQLLMARFYSNRQLFESREKLARMYSWQVFLISNFAVEFVSQTLISIVMFLAWYVVSGLWCNAADLGDLPSRASLTFLLIWGLQLLFQTFSHMLMTFMPNVPTGVNIGSLLLTLSLIFSGILVPPTNLPRFFTWLHYSTPFSYFVSSALSATLAGIPMQCAPRDLLHMEPFSGQTCGQYLAAYISREGGQLMNPDAVENCMYCPYTTTDKYSIGLASALSKGGATGGF